MTTRLESYQRQLRILSSRAERWFWKYCAGKLAPHLPQGVHIDGVNIVGEGVTLQGINAYGDGKAAAVMIKGPDLTWPEES